MAHTRQGLKLIKGLRDLTSMALQQQLTGDAKKEKRCVSWQQLL